MCYDCKKIDVKQLLLHEVDLETKIIKIKN